MHEKYKKKKKGYKKQGQEWRKNSIYSFRKECVCMYTRVRNVFTKVLLFTYLHLYNNDLYKGLYRYIQLMCKL